MIINFNGVDYDIVNWDEFAQTLLTAIGIQMESQIVKEINNAGLVSTGALKNSLYFSVEGNELIVGSTAPHAAYVEFGTPGTKKGVIDPFGESSASPNRSRKMPLVKKGEQYTLVPELQRWAKQKGIREENWFALAKSIQEKGLEPRAPFRKVLYNDKNMERIVEKAAKLASR